MKKQELINLRKYLEEEIERRKRINELLNNTIIKEYISLTGSKVEYQNINKNTIINEITKDIKYTDTNGIYVWTDAFAYSFDLTYEEYHEYLSSIDYDNPTIKFKRYMNIENYRICSARIEKEHPNNILISDFEKENIVLNPYNSSNNNNGFNEIRNDFLSYSLDYGQVKAKKLLLEKYSRI